MIFQLISIYIFIGLILYSLIKYKKLITPFSFVGLWYLCLFISSLKLSAYYNEWLIQDWIILIFAPLLLIIPLILSRKNISDTNKLVFDSLSLRLIEIAVDVIFIIGMLVFILEFFHAGDLPIFGENSFNSYSTFGIKYLHYLVNLQVFTSFLSLILFYQSKSKFKIRYLLYHIVTVLIFVFLLQRLNILIILISSLFVKEYVLKIMRLRDLLFVFIFFVIIFDILGQFRVRSADEDYLLETSKLIKVENKKKTIVTKENRIVEATEEDQIRQFNYQTIITNTKTKVPDFFIRASKIIGDYWKEITIFIISLIIYALSLIFDFSKIFFYLVNKIKNVKINGNKKSDFIISFGSENDKILSNKQTSILAGIASVVMLFFIGFVIFYNTNNNVKAYLRNQVVSHSYLTSPYVYISTSFENFVSFRQQNKVYTNGLRSLYPLWAFTFQKEKLSNIDEEEFRVNKNYTTFTYLKPFYGDFGILGDLISSFIIGIFIELFFYKLLNEKYSIWLFGISWFLLVFLIFSSFENLLTFPPFIFQIIVFSGLFIIYKIILHNRSLLGKLFPKIFTGK